MSYLPKSTCRTRCQRPSWGRGRWRNTARGATVATLSTVLTNCQHTAVRVMLLSHFSTEPRVTSVPASPYAYSQSGTQTLNVSDQSQASSIHPPDPLKLGTVTSASHLANCKCKCTKNNMSPWRDILLRRQYTDLIWDLHGMATDKPQAVTLGKHLQQLQCCTPWQTAMMPIHRGDLFLTKLSITTHIYCIHYALTYTGYTCN